MMWKPNFLLSFSFLYTDSHTRFSLPYVVNMLSLPCGFYVGEDVNPAIHYPQVEMWFVVYNIDISQKENVNGRKRDCVSVRER